MLARCARCQGTFTTDRFGRQVCPHCGSELDLADPNAPPPAAPSAPPPRPAAPEQGAAPPPPTPPQGGGELPPPPGPPPGGYGPPGGWPPPTPPGGGWGGYRPPSASEPELPAPFAERKQRGLAASFFDTWKLVATEPHRFFRRVRVREPGSAVLYGVIAYVLGTAVQTLYGLVAGQQALMGMEQATRNMPPQVVELLNRFAGPASAGAAIGTTVLSPLLGVIGIYVIAGVLHLLLMLFRGASRGFDATLTVVGYGFGLDLLLAVPACGGLVAGVWLAVVLVIGLAEAQRCGLGKALAAVLAPLVIACACACFASAAVGIQAARLFGQQPDGSSL